ncbi:MAG: hypothetical protein DRI90_01115 [Deltaproteobacteria bacterium]|nr:MAG: hypothetical protein DRI90_01115 [Deltaproteobacteria bacterium]
MSTDAPRRHALLEITAKSLRAARPDDRGFVRPKALGSFDVVVGPASVERALAILAQLLEAASQQGIRFRADRESWNSVAQLAGETISLRLIEDKARSKHKLTTDERAYTKADLIFRRIPEWDYSPSGVLAFQVTEPGVYDTRRRWGEGRRGPLEAKIPSLLDGLRKIAEAMAEARARRAVREQEAQERERRESERRIRESKVRSFQDAILTQVAGWDSATRLREYVEAVERKAAAGGPGPTIELVRWSSWARAVANSIDPLARPTTPWEMDVPEWEPAR